MVTRERKAILFGDYTNAPYHPLQNVEAEVIRALSGSFGIEASEEADVLISSSNPDVDLFISYADRWSGTVTDEQADALLSFIRGGGGLLSLHCGICLASHPRLLPLFGGRFVSHPAFQPLAYSPAGPSAAEQAELAESAGGESADGRTLAALRASLQPFVIDEEPYVYELTEAPQGDREVLLHYAFEGQLYPALWTQTYGQGRIVNVQPGHTAQALSLPAVQQLLTAAAKWAARR
ncbi:ThuA domain-containing protein [Paenibacillus kobensis]|uniref:ThuA domain-containing protein n=1 Tax=Paenibacillus kobensis TaxID=59841 RepID=UPI000FDA83C4|nr:ThuA domain-containing protein [Paenibacillus kobensis]